jgi:hypothetical protein
MRHKMWRCESKVVKLYCERSLRGEQVNGREAKEAPHHMGWCVAPSAHRFSFVRFVYEQAKRFWWRGNF